MDVPITLSEYLTDVDLNEALNTVNLHTASDLKAAFGELYPPLVRFAHRFLTNTEACEDVVQDLFVALYQEKRSFENVQALKNYCYAATKNRCLNIVKHEKVKQQYAQFTLYTTNQLEGFELETETANIIHSALKKLSDRKREILELHLKGLNNDDTATRLNIKVQTDKNLKAKAYKELRGLLAKYKS